MKSGSVAERIVALVGGRLHRPVTMCTAEEDKCERHHGKALDARHIFDRFVAGSAPVLKPVVSGVDDFTIEPADAARKTLEAFRALPGSIRGLRDGDGRPLYPTMESVYRGLASGDLDVHEGQVRNARGIRAREAAKAALKAELAAEAAAAAVKGDKPV